MQQLHVGEERDNLTRIGFAILDEVQDAVRIVIESNIPDSLEKVLNNHKHRVFHCFKKKCHNKRCSMSHRNILTKDQMKIVFNKSSHGDENLSFCCSTAIQGIQTEKMDLTFLYAFLKIFPEMIYWQSCLKNPNKSIQDLINENKHKLYHLYDKNRCCECLSVNSQCIDGSYLTKSKFQKLFGKQASVTCRKTGSQGNCICIFSAKNISQTSLEKDDTLTRIVLDSCCSTKQCVDALVKVRNEARGHCINSKMSVEEFKKNWEIIENKVPELLKHGLLDGPEKEETVKKFIKRLKDLKHKPLTEELHRQIIKELLQQHECEQQLMDLRQQLQSGLESFQSVPRDLESVKKMLVTIIKKNDIVQEIQYIKELFEKLHADLEHLQSVPSDLETVKKGIADIIEKICPQGTTYTPQLEKTSQAENTFPEEVIYKRHDGYTYDVLILHTTDDGCHVDDMKKIIIENANLPDLKFASVEYDILPGANLFEAYNKLIGESRSLLLFITPGFYEDFWAKHRTHVQLVRHIEEGEIIIPVVFGEENIRNEFNEVRHLKKVIFYKDKDSDKGKAFIKTITAAIKNIREQRN